MTAIVGLVDNGIVYMGADSAGVAGLSLNIRQDEKVFYNGPFLMGGTTSFRMIQLLRYKFVPPIQKKNQDDMKYMVADFIDAVRKCFAQNGFGDMQDKSSNKGGSFLVGYKGKIYYVGSDFQIGYSLQPYNAVGCGAEIALGALHSTKDLIKDPQKRVELALEAAAAHSAGVSAPFVILQQKKFKNSKAP